MATMIGDQIITLGTTATTFVKAWVAKYHNELLKKNTMVKTAVRVADGAALTLRVSHQVTKGIAGHVVSLEVEKQDPDVATTKLLAKVQAVITHIAGNAVETAEAQTIATALCEWIPTVIGDILANRTD